MVAPRRALFFALLLLFGPVPATARPPDPPEAAARPDPASPEAICALIGAEAERRALPKAFFARLIWKESRFDIHAVSPVGAQGVAQFMPYTAKERGLADPFDPAQAIPASADYLAELRDAFGNFGLAAAAYNGGPDRVSRWLANRARLPAETHDYVLTITARPADWFRRKDREVEDRPLLKDASFEAGCLQLPVIATRAAPRPPWGVVVAGGRNRGAALIAFERAKRSARGQIDPARLHVLRRARRATGPRYLAVLGAESRSEAQKLCLRLRRAGAPCTIRRN
ncbi:lytic transglycosylase domain-containing protein [Pikeienuella piscinae]|uniref:Lytic transglycosylase domain-containing protein n=1 Tax=Pikeienuella piscinae TaxID=2748098 RepID=A0A7L5BV43_9RHOB|nr:lytic transglycosylase domain-containing protein [Pikeienuella piscinae]QIE54036.1 lytic transglycosylase domain-containing protein [Pikeienuella piscinae]